MLIAGFTSAMLLVAQHLHAFDSGGPPEVLMPTGFTPNGDGSNDAYLVQGIGAYPENRITVHDRWGRVVYDRIRYANDWRGEDQRGDDLPEGTYFVVLTLSPGGVTLSNYVDLRR